MTTESSSRGSLPEAWRVQLPVFEGPLDLLLHLVRVNEVEITDIPVAMICDQFHEYLGLMEELNLDIAAEYIYEAALLIYLKSRLLLPRRSSEEGEEEGDPRQELVERLLEYRRIQQASQTLAEIHSVRSGMWTRQPQTPELLPDEESYDIGDVSVFDLLGALRTVLVRFDHEHPDPLHLRRETFAVRGQFERLMEGLERGRPLDLVADLRGRSCRAEAVAAFLAVLELVRRSLVRLHRTDGGELLLYRTEREFLRHELEAVPE